MCIYIYVYRLFERRFIDKVMAKILNGYVVGEACRISTVARSKEIFYSRSKIRRFFWSCTNDYETRNEVIRHRIDPSFSLLSFFFHGPCTPLLLDEKKKREGERERER